MKYFMFPHYLKAYSEMNVLLSSAKQLLSLEYTTYFRNSLNHLMCVCFQCYVLLCDSERTDCSIFIYIIQKCTSKGITGGHKVSNTAILITDFTIWICSIAVLLLQPTSVRFKNAFFQISYFHFNCFILAQTLFSLHSNF